MIMIDDAEYTDNESLQIFDVLTKRDMAFFVISFGRKLDTKIHLYLRLSNKGQVRIVRFFSNIYYFSIKSKEIS